VQQLFASFHIGHAIQIREEDNSQEVGSASSHTTKSNTSPDIGEEATAQADPLGLRTAGLGTCSIKHRYSYDPATGTVTTPSRQFTVLEHSNSPQKNDQLHSPGPRTVVRKPWQRWAACCNTVNATEDMRTARRGNVMRIRFFPRPGAFTGGVYNDAEPEGICSNLDQHQRHKGKQ
jgi:hypothetical protein